MKIKKTHKEIKLNNEVLNNFNVRFGTTNKFENKIVYLNLSSWLYIDCDEFDCIKKIDTLKYKINRKLKNELIGLDKFNNNYLISVLNVSKTSLLNNGRSFFSCEINLKQEKDYLKITDPTLINEINIIRDVILELFNKEEGFSFKLKTRNV
jgi:hypothetical protein